MRILMYLCCLVAVESLALGFAVVLDYCGKQKNYDKIMRKKINVLFISSKYEKQFGLSKKGRPISKQSFVFQVVNLIYALAYSVVAVIEVFVKQNDCLLLINIISAIVYGGICPLAMIAVDVLTNIHIKK